MGVYNGANKLEKSVHSILNQSFNDFEFIICDDGSTDNSIEILKKLAREDKRIKLLSNKKNLGLAKTLNNCIEASKGEYIARMDDDDFSHEYRFEKQVKFLDAHPEIAIVGTSRNMYDANGIWGKSISEGERNKTDIYLGRTFAHPSTMYRRSAIIAVSGYTTGEETERTEDFDLWCKLYDKGYVGYNMADVLIDYYEARDSYNKRKYKYRVCEYKLKKKWRKKLGLPLIYDLYSYKPLLVGLIPVTLLEKHHKGKFSINT